MNRLGFIGGSDTIKIMNGEWLSLWQVKTGRREPDDLSDNIAVQLGIHTESFNISWFERVYQASVESKQRSFSEEIGTVPVVGTIDGMWNNCIVEAKHTNNFSTMDTMLTLYMPQLQTYMRLSDAEGAYLSVIFGNSKWEAAHIARNDAYFDSMWGVVSDFWGYVLRDEEPVAVDAPSISIEKIPVDNMVIRNASTDNAFIDAAHTYVENQAAAGSFESAKKSLKDMVGPNEREVYCDLLSIKRSKNGALRFTVR
jgi:predicted phage-related endonuclease